MPGPDHVVIIGAGITGALVSRLLLEQGVAVTVLEAREKGAGSSSRSAACIRQQFSTPATVQGMIHSVQAYGRFREDFRCSDATANVLVQNGYLFLYDRPEAAEDPVTANARWKTAQANVQMQRAHGLSEVELLSPEDVKGRFPHIDVSELLGATFCPTDGFLRPDVIYMEGFRRFEELGGILRQNEAVVGGRFDARGQLVALQTSKEEEVEADVFINATNAWGLRVSKSLGGMELAIAPLKRYLYFIQRGPHTAPEDLLRWPMTITGSRAYCRPENRDQLLAGWAHATEPDPEFSWDDQDSIEPDYFHRSGLDNYGYQLWIQLAEALAAVGEFAGLSATTAGYYAVTPDHNPLIGFDTRQERLLHAVGFSGHGAMLGPFTAQAILAMTLAQETLPSVNLDGIEVDLRQLLVTRNPGRGEGMVI